MSDLPPIMTTEETSYLDYDAFLAPDFSPTAYANKLVLSTNDPTDTPIDLSTPLSRVLFDVQEVDIRIDSITTKNALPLLEYTQSRAEASTRIHNELSSQITSVNEGYARLERSIGSRYERAAQLQLATERSMQVSELARVLSRCLALSRQLESQMDELGITVAAALTNSTASASSASKTRDGHRAMPVAARTVLELRGLFGAAGATPGIERVTTYTATKNNVVAPLEKALTGLAQQTIREFSIAALGQSTPSPSAALSPASPLANPTFLQSEQARSRTSSALAALYLLSPCPPGTKEDNFEPRLLITALTSFLQANLTSSLASLARALATLPTLERTLTEVTGRCMNVVALEQVLASTSRGVHPGLISSAAQNFAPVKPKSADKAARRGARDGTNAASSDESSSDSDTEDEEAIVAKKKARAQRSTSALLLADEPLLPILWSSLDTSSLASYFWRTLAGNLTARVNEILSRGGVSARTLRSNKERVVSSVRECVLKASQGDTPGSTSLDRGGVGDRKWDREAAVMVSSILGPLVR